MAPTVRMDYTFTGTNIMLTHHLKTLNTITIKAQFLIMKDKIKKQ